MTKLSPVEVAKIQAALAAARQGRATLEQLAHAHRLAEGQNLNGTLGELREHIRRMTPAPPLRNEAKSIMLGVISGLLTWTILGQRPGPLDPPERAKRR
jgi:hypothetical protein